MQDFSPAQTLDYWASVEMRAGRRGLSCGCTKVGEIPRYALLPGGGVPAATSVFFKELR
jgi:hypothetical protein